MSGTSSGSNDICSRIQELIVWYPGRALEQDERSRVEKHAAGCTECAGLLRFVSDFKEVVVEKWAPHPSAEALVTFAENRTGMDPRQRFLVDEHLAACSDCREQVVMLEEVERTALEEKAGTGSDRIARRVSVGAPSRLREFWESLKGGVLRPEPAAVYLTVALLAVGLLVLRPGGPLIGTGDRDSGQAGLRTVAGAIPATLSGVVLLPDETYRTRRPGQEETPGVRIDAGSAQVLLLELTGLEDPPVADHTYTVRLLLAGSTKPVLEATVLGREFQENYSLCLSLDAGALETGSYVVTILDPDSQSVFESTVVAQ